MNASFFHNHMKNILRNGIFLAALGFAAMATSSAAFAQEPAQQGARDTTLESLRAGAVNDSALVLATTEREAMASAAAPVLETLRATDIDFSDHEMEIILVTVAIVLLIVIIA